MVALTHLYKLLMTLGNACNIMLNGKSRDIKLYLQYEFNYFKKCVEKRLRGNRLNALWLPLSSAVRVTFGCFFILFCTIPFKQEDPFHLLRLQPVLFSLFLLAMK